MNHSMERSGVRPPNRLGHDHARFSPAGACELARADNLEATAQGSLEFERPCLFPILAQLPLNAACLCRELGSRHDLSTFDFGSRPCACTKVRPKLERLWHAVSIAPADGRCRDHWPSAASAKVHNATCD